VHGGKTGETQRIEWKLAVEKRLPGKKMPPIGSLIRQVLSVNSVFNSVSSVTQIDPLSRDDSAGFNHERHERHETHETMKFDRRRLYLMGTPKGELKKSGISPMVFFSCV
jgi:hypothetical protein